MPITKHNYIVKDVNKLCECIKRSICHSKRGKTGACAIDICKDVTADVADYQPEKLTKIYIAFYRGRVRY